MGKSYVCRAAEVAVVVAVAARERWESFVRFIDRGGRNLCASDEPTLRYGTHETREEPKSGSGHDICCRTKWSHSFPFGSTLSALLWLFLRAWCDEILCTSLVEGPFVRYSSLLLLFVAVA